MIYVASPYTSIEPSLETHRYYSVMRYVAEQMKIGRIMFSPILHCRQLSLVHNMPCDFEFWRDYCLGMLNNADAFEVLCLPGYETSHGVNEELKFARTLGIQITFVQP